MNINNYVVIMAGGVGSRFWPYSRNSRPKQFIDVLGTGKSLLQLTYDRFLGLCHKDNILIVTNNIYADLVKEQLPDLSDDQILLEPARRNTAPCIAYAAYKIKSKNPNAVMMVTPADHAIFNEGEFQRVMNDGARAAAGDSTKLITIGIQPNRPETGYGYIQFMEDAGTNVKKVKTFTEKPPLEMAQAFLQSGDFLWNAGIFVWSVSAIVAAFEESLPDMAEVFAGGNALYYTDEEQTYIDDIYTQCDGISIDYGVLEKSNNVYVIPGSFDWSDLGSWNSLHEHREKDQNDNVLEGNIILGDCKDNYIKSDTKRLIVVDQLEGYLIADFDDVLLICKKDQDAKFREYVSMVKSKTGDTYL